MSRAKDIIAELLDLAPDEQDQVRAMLAQINGKAPDDDELSGRPQKDVEIVWRTVVTVAQNHGLDFPPASVVMRHSAYKKLVPNCKRLMKFVEKFDPKNRIERSIALELCVESVFRWMNDRLSYMPITIKTLTDQLGYVSQAVDAQLPGYAASGLLPVAISGLRPLKT